MLTHRKRKKKRMRNREKARKKKESKKKGNPPHPKGKKKEINKERRKREKEKKIKKEKDHLQQKNIYVKHKKRVLARMRVHTHAYRRTCTRTSHDGRRKSQQHETPPETPFVLSLTAFLPFCSIRHYPERKNALRTAYFAAILFIAATTVLFRILA